jgi:phosphatidylglycerophosphate synthase
MVDWHLGMVESEAGEPRPLGPADALTLTRAWLVPLALDHPTPLVCLLAAGTDALDGPVARRGKPTRAGRDLEGLVDVAFALAALEGTRRRSWLGPRVVALEATRLSAGVLYALLAYLGAIRRPADAVVRAGRVGAGLRAAALVLASRRPVLASGLLIAGSAAALGALPVPRRALASALARPGGSSGTPGAGAVAGASAG